MQKPSKTLVIIDGNAIIHRAYHALPPLTTKDGTMVNAVYGFATMLLKVLADIKPTHLAVTFDMEGPTFRDEIFDHYKATRVKADQALYDQIPLVHTLVHKWGAKVYEKKGYEADDVIGTIVAQAKKTDDIATVIVTGDMDTLQLVDDARGVRVYALRKGMSDIVQFDEEKVRERYEGLGPDMIIDYKALKGDQSDNIPGVKGIGDKTAIALLKECGSLEGVYKALDKKDAPPSLTPSVRKKLETSKDNAFLSKKLATIHQEVPIDFLLTDCAFTLTLNNDLLDFLRKMEFYSLVNRLQGNPEAKKEIKKTKAASGKKRPPIHTIGKNTLWEDVKKTLNHDYLLVATVGDPAKNFEGFVLGTPQALVCIPWESITQKEKTDILATISKAPLVIGHDLKNVIHALLRFSAAPLKKMFDTMIAAYVLSPGKRAYDLPTLALQYLEVALELKSAQGSLFSADLQPVAEELWHVDSLYHHLVKELIDNKLDTLFDSIEMPLIPVLAHMENVGVKIDELKLKSISAHVERELERVSRKIFKYAGEEFNISSSVQMRDILYNKLGLETYGVKKGKTGLSTAASELGKLYDAHPVIPLIIEHRELTKLKTTYIDVLPTLINKTTGRIHSHFNQAVTSTGRLSSSDPNLQNIPIRTALGKEIRDAFIAEDGHLLVVADYSQVELRIVASLANDKKMIEVFTRGGDIHRATASAIHEVPEMEVTDEMRRSAKEVNFGILYGMGAHGLAMRTGITRVAAAEFIKKYFDTFKGVKKYADDIIAHAKKTGYVETLYGRRRFIPELSSTNAQVQRSGERMAINLPVQGTAADLIKLAMIEVEKEITKKHFAHRAHLTLQIHDELILEVDEEIAPDVALLTKKAMEKVSTLNVPIVANVEIGKRWGDTK